MNRDMNFDWAARVPHNVTLAWIDVQAAIGALDIIRDATHVVNRRRVDVILRLTPKENVMQEGSAFLLAFKVDTHYLN